MKSCHGTESRNLKSPTQSAQPAELKQRLKGEGFLFLPLAAILEIAQNIEDMVDIMNTTESFFCTGHPEKAFILKCFFKESWAREESLTLLAPLNFGLGHRLWTTLPRLWATEPRGVYFLTSTPLDCG